MKRKFVMIVAAVALSVPLAPAAFARDGHRDDHRGGGYRDDDRRGYDRELRDRYVIHYHLDGRSRSVHAKSHDRAKRIVDLMRSIGAEAHLDSRHVVHYSMRGKKCLVRRSHEDAHRLAQKLEGYGFDAHVDHE